MEILSQNAMRALYAHAESSAGGGLSEEQLAAVKGITFEQPGMDAIVAGAGAGKTRCLSYLVCKALASDRIRNCHILTTTRTAKDEAYSRVSSLFADLKFVEYGIEALKPAFVKTIHAFGLQAIRVQLEQDGNDRQVEVVGQGVIRGFFKKELERHTTAADFHPPAEDICAVLPPKDAVDLMLSTRTERLKYMVDPVDASPGDTSAACLEAVEAIMQTNDHSDGNMLVDFDRIIRTLADSSVPIINEGDLLVVDEAQDLSLCQMTVVLNAIKAPNRNVLVLGDDSQGIFQFSGAVDNTIKKMITACEDFGIRTSRYNLFTNHRSTNQIVSASERVLPAEDRRSREGVRGTRDGHRVEVLHRNADDRGSAQIADCACLRDVSERLFELLETGYSAGDIVVMRHKAWSWDDSLVRNLLKSAKSKGVEFPICLLGVNMNSSIIGSLASILQVAVGSDLFCGGDKAASRELLASFVKSVRCTKGTPPLTLSVFQTVMDDYNCDIATLFIEKCDLMLECWKAKVSASEPSSQSNENPPKKKQKANDPNAPSTKEKNFVATMELLKKVCILLKGCINAIVLNNGPLPHQLIILQAPRSVFSNLRDEPRMAPEQSNLCPPRVKLPPIVHRMGDLVWMIIRDVLSFKFTSLSNPADPDEQELKNVASEHAEIVDIVNALDVDVPETTLSKNAIECIHDAIEGPMSKLLDQKNTKDSEGRCVFSTVHRFKGKERKVAVCTGMKEPFCGDIKLARRACLSNKHDPGCKNVSGQGDCACKYYKSALADIRQGSLNESMRRDYVALSRARERLIVALDSIHPRLALLEYAS
jgi:superfamily I DNA/RNA helicase